MKNTFLVYIMFLFFASCDLPDNNQYVIIEETPVEIVDEDEIETDEIIIIEEVQTMELQPIKEYQKYVTSGSGVYGINGNRLEEILLKDSDDNQHLFNQFFILDGMIYLSVKGFEQGNEIPDTDPVQYEQILKEYFFSQTGGQIDEELKKDFPNMPLSDHILYPNDGLFEIITFPYPVDDVMMDTSRVIRGGTPEGYLKIDGCSRVSGGFWFSVPEPIKTRLKGVYLWPEMGSKIRKLDSGRIW